MSHDVIVRIRAALADGDLSAGDLGARAVYALLLVLERAREVGAAQRAELYAAPALSALNVLVEFAENALREELERINR